MSVSTNLMQLQMTLPYLIQSGYSITPDNTIPSLLSTYTISVNVPLGFTFKSGLRLLIVWPQEIAYSGSV